MTCIQSTSNSPEKNLSGIALISVPARAFFGALFGTLLLALICVSPLRGESASCSTDPALTSRVTNTAAGVTGNYSGNSFLTISGIDLPNTPFAIGSAAPGGTLPIAVANTMALVNGTPAYIFSYNVGQLELLTPQLTGCVSLYVEQNGVAYFQAQLYFNPTAPGLFTMDDRQTVVASHNDWSLVTASAPAHAGEWITLWAAGLGPLNPPLNDGEIARSAAELNDKAHFSVLLDGASVDPSAIEYAGVAPGYAGLYQINVKLPAGLPPNPEIRVSTMDNISPTQRFLAVQ